MPRRLFLALLLLVAAPMVLLGWMTAGAVRANQDAAKENLATLLSSQLDDADRNVSQLFDGYAARLNAALDDGGSVIQNLRRMRRELPIVRQGIYVDPDGLMRFPSPDDSVSVDAAEVAAALPGLVDARPLPDRPSDRNPKETAASQTPTANTSPPETTKQQRRQHSNPPQAVFPTPAASEGPFVDSTWQQWYMADGAQVVYWRTRADGSTVGVLLERSRWIADLIGVLPDDRHRVVSAVTADGTATSRSVSSMVRTPTPIGSVSLVDEAKRSIYRWGDPAEFKFSPLVSKELSPPLASWQLKLHVDQSLMPDASSIPLYFSLGGIALLVLSVGFYVLTSVQRQISEAKSRVNFAGQVSHELRTPLTNLRLYTELAESDLRGLDDGAVKASLAKRLVVIDHESRRLQRLVSGVLEMIRPTGKPIGVRTTPTDPCGLIRAIADQFEPSFEVAGLQLETRCDVVDEISIDPDIVEMVLVNLLSNVEKYVPTGGRCGIHCDRVNRGDPRGETLRIVVSDDGPGIGPADRTKVFRPFVRVDDSIRAPSGTGIGLTIARRAARRHGGDLVLRPDAELGGATFVLTLPILDDASSQGI
jgi:signal transduction histidine kinase